MPTSYPDISDIIARKQAGRRAAAAKPFAEKVAELERLRARARALRKSQPVEAASVGDKNGLDS